MPFLNETLDAVFDLYKSGKYRPLSGTFSKIGNFACPITVMELEGLRKPESPDCFAWGFDGYIPTNFPGHLKEYGKMGYDFRNRLQEADISVINSHKAREKYHEEEIKRMGMLILEVSDTDGLENE